MLVVAVPQPPQPLIRPSIANPRAVSALRLCRRSSSEIPAMLCDLRPILFCQSETKASVECCDSEKE
jgi:hypothetical protein